MIKILLHAVVGDKYVRKAVSIIVGKPYTQSTPLFCGDTGALTHVGEGSIAVVVIKDVSGGGKFFRWTIRVVIAAAVFTVLGVPVHVSGNKQIQFPVIVVVEKPGGDRPATPRNSCLRRHVREGSVAIVVIQNILSVISDE